MDYFSQVPITGFWLGKTNGRGQEVIKGEKKEKSRVYIPFALSLRAIVW